MPAPRHQFSFSSLQKCTPISKVRAILIRVNSRHTGGVIISTALPLSSATPIQNPTNKIPAHNSYINFPIQTKPPPSVNVVSSHLSLPSSPPSFFFSQSNINKLFFRLKTFTMPASLPYPRASLNIPWALDLTLAHF